MDRKSRQRIQEAKQKARPELCKDAEGSGWTKFGFAEDVTDFSKCKEQNLTRLDGNEITVEQFIKDYEGNYIPCVIAHLQDHWPAVERWKIQKLVKKYRNQKFKCGEDDDGYSVKMKMKYFVNYMKHNKDDSPLYIFDSSFSDHVKRRHLLDDFQVPRMFPDDYFSLVGEAKRPPYRWFVMGSARSGTGIHIDPLGTSAWNALLQGHKRWCLFPPQTPKELLKPKQAEAWKQKGEAITWFKFVYPRVSSDDWPSQYKMFECIQGPGETMFVPGGWWHVVLNLDDTVAITQNYCSRVNFPVVYKKTVKGRPKMSKKWHKMMQLKKPELARVADKIDITEEDGYASSSSSSSSSSSEGSSIDSDSDSVWSDDEDDQPPAKQPRLDPSTSAGMAESSDSEDYKSTSSSPTSSR